MTSVSQQSQIPSQASSTNNASQSTQSYASATKKAVSSPPVATSSSSPSPALAVGGAAPVQQHGKSSSISPVNGRPAIPPAVPAVTTPAVLHSSNPMNNSSTDHSRKSSVTISANGGYIPNGGPVGSQKAGIQFGSLSDSPAASYSTPQITQPTSSAPISIPSNPRVISPAQSPSPIQPPPVSSGGRPPSGLAQQGNVMIFGSPSGDGDVSFLERRGMVCTNSTSYSASHENLFDPPGASCTWYTSNTPSTRVLWRDE
jgi:translation initiation factor 4G